MRITQQRGRSPLTPAPNGVLLPYNFQDIQDFWRQHR